MSLLPSRGPDTDTSQDGELQVVGVDEDVAAVLDALSSETARDILNAVYDDPGTPSDLADRLDMSIQKVSYHLEKLQEEDLIAVAGTQYSEKGQEMTVYEPPEDPLVVFVGTPDRKRTVRSVLERFVPAIGLLTAASVMVQVVFGRVPGLFGSPGSEAEPASGAGPTSNETGTDTPDEAATPTPESEPSTPDDGGGVKIQETTETPAATETEVATDAPAETATETPTPDEPSTPVEMAGEATETVTAVASGGGVELEPGVAFFLGGLLVLTVLGATWAYTG